MIKEFDVLGKYADLLSGGDVNQSINQILFV